MSSAENVNNKWKELTVKKVYYLIPILILVVLTFLSHQPDRKVTSQEVTSASHDNWQNIPLPKEVTDQLETGQIVNDYLTREAVEDLEGHLVSESDKVLFERYKQDGFALVSPSIRVYSAKSSEYTQFSFLMQKESQYIAFIGNYYARTKNVIFVTSNGIQIEIR